MAASCSTPSGGVSLCSSGMPLARGPWKRTTATKSRSSSPRLKAAMQVVLVVEHDGRRLDRPAVLAAYRRVLITRAAEIARQQAQAAFGPERIGDRAQDVGSPRLASARAPDQRRRPRGSGSLAIAREAVAGDGVHVLVQQAGVEQLADHEGHAAGGVEVVHVGRAVRIDARQQRRRRGDSSSKSSQSQIDARRARHGDQVQGVVGRAAGGHAGRPCR